MNENLINTPLRRFISLLRDEKKEIYAIYFYAVLNGLVSLSLPLGIQAILNFILGGRLTTSWVLLVIIVALGVIFGGYLQISQLYLTEKLQQRVFGKSAMEFSYRLPRIKTEAFRGKYAPELVNRFFDTINLQKGLSKILIDFSTASLQVFFGLILLAIYHPFFILFSVMLVLILYLIFKYTSPTGMATSLKESSAKYEVAFWLEEIARTLGTFKLSGFSPLPFKRVDKLVGKYLEFRNSHFAVLIFQYKIMIAFKTLIVVTLLVAGSLLLMNNEISIGQFVAAEIIIVLIINSVEKLILSLETVYDTLTATEKLGLIMDMDLERSEGIDKGLDLSQSGLAYEFRELTYHPGDKKFPNIQDINLKIDSGEKIVITGESGAGKSTFLQLMAGLIEDYQGNIIVNKLPMETLALEKLRSMIGDSLSRQSIFHGTIRENITVGNETISETKLREVLQLVGLSDYIYGLKDDLETQLLPEGKHLSNANISKIILARSLCFEPKLLLLEEELNYLNGMESDTLLNYIFSGPWTLVAVSADDRMLRRADRILILDAGKVAFDGSFEAFQQYKKNNKN
ncbi:peptidase domain-containing ABC transporter [Cyclobacterium jeungdonense]|uniref:ATP-binding cassette domain-containing protein n=1 Tax=Cyclobacterium jeungdonense TaxID=708087 RepID=A0ABT8C8J2_9BACT|nr:ATP-binding cassette domain-containing protein [Cyclobacterium jeungdonense]MDN3688392.1 ATP-binding cassette domain-containing protein [Cyclobacterium jeungdonense]